ncbi:MAG: HlyC/CorC family transporter [Magnetococcales bacterium]|nr:HlyC/CorC family transporter [Magnetococcales bacterium]NGZ06767.1 HlyC/CorC family transporter [Magnetococcales bacterium]
MEAWMTLPLIVVCLMVEAFYAGSEIAVVSADRLKLRHMAAKGSLGAKLAMDMLRKPEHLLTTTLVGINVAIVTNSSLSTLFAIDVLGQENAWIGIMISAPLIWVFGEIVPKSIFQQRADYLAPRIIYVLKVSSYLFYPLIVIFSILFKMINKIFGGKDKNAIFTLREEIDQVLQMHAHETDILPMEKNMIRRLFNFGETQARDIMVPLIELRALERNATIGQALRMSGEHAHLLLPVHAGRVDNVVGYVNAVELLGLPESKSITSHIQPIRYIPGAKSIEDLLTSFQKDGDRLAIIVDEFGGCEGMITLEDILERVVGDMRDEYDTSEKGTTWWQMLQPGHWRVNPRMRLVALRDELGITLPDGHYETLGGFLLDHFQDIPAEGATLTRDGTQFTVIKATRQAIREVEIQMASMPQDQTAGHFAH